MVRSGWVDHAHRRADGIRVLVDVVLPRYALDHGEHGVARQQIQELSAVVRWMSLLRQKGRPIFLRYPEDQLDAAGIDPLPGDFLHQFTDVDVLWLQLGRIGGPDVGYGCQQEREGQQESSVGLHGTSLRKR